MSSEAEVKLPKSDNADDCCICTYQTASTKPYLGIQSKSRSWVECTTYQ